MTCYWDQLLIKNVCQYLWHGNLKQNMKCKYSVRCHFWFWKGMISCLLLVTNCVIWHIVSEFHAWSEKFSKINLQTEGYFKGFLGKSTCLSKLQWHTSIKLANSTSTAPDCRFSFTTETESMQKNCKDFLRSTGIQC